MKGINHKLGKRPGPSPVPENRLTNNLIATKLKIALNLKSEDMIRILALTGIKLSNHELSVFFRKPGHKHFRNRTIISNSSRAGRKTIPVNTGKMR